MVLLNYWKVAKAFIFLSEIWISKMICTEMRMTVKQVEEADQIAMCGSF